ncbi:MAG: hypothetical protein ABSB09_09555 [Acidimicrobiales bacterium]|jgi:hypothetical protein
MRRLPIIVGLVALLLPVGVVSAGPARGASAAAPATCGGTVAAPGVVPGGTYASLTVTGVCDVSAGQVVVEGDVVVDPGAALVSGFARDDGAIGTASSLAVDGNLIAGTGASLLLGCEPSEFPCYDDPDPDSPTLSSTTTVEGSVVATDPLGVVMHHSVVGGDVTEAGGGGGITCAPSTTSVFSGIPGNYGSVYSDYEDLTIGGNLRVTGVRSCWFGALRLTVAGSATFTDNTYADSDADEILDDRIGGNLLCTDLSPRVQFGDAGQGGSTVGGYGTGDCAFSRFLPYPGDPTQALPIAAPAPGLHGYWLAASDGGIFSFGQPFHGSGASRSLAVSGFASAPGGTGYQLASGSGSIVGFGPHAGCTGAVVDPVEPIVGLADAPGGGGCWSVAADGGVFAFGPNAPFYGSAGDLMLNEPVVGMAPTPNGDGYYLVAGDGGIFSYGPGAVFEGSMGGQHLNRPIVGMAVDPSTGGYWLVAADGGIFSFGAPFLGSLGGVHLDRPIVGMAAAPGGDGYYLVAADGGVFAFGPGATFQGSTGALTLNRPIIGMALG